MDRGIGLGSRNPAVIGRRLRTRGTGRNRCGKLDRRHGPGGGEIDRRHRAGGGHRIRGRRMGLRSRRFWRGPCRHGTLDTRRTDGIARQRRFRRSLCAACVLGPRILLAEQLACGIVQADHGIVVHVPGPFGMDLTSGGSENRHDMPWFQPTAGGFPGHRLHADGRRRQSAFDQLIDGAHLAVLRSGHRQELFDRILFSVSTAAEKRRTSVVLSP